MFQNIKPVENVNGCVSIIWLNYITYVENRAVALSIAGIPLKRGEFWKMFEGAGARPRPRTYKKVHPASAGHLRFAHFKSSPRFSGIHAIHSFRQCSYPALTGHMPARNATPLNKTTNNWGSTRVEKVNSTNETTVRTLTHTGILLHSANAEFRRIIFHSRSE